MVARRAFSCTFNVAGHPRVPDWVRLPAPRTLVKVISQPAWPERARLEGKAPAWPERARLEGKASAWPERARLQGKAPAWPERAWLQGKAPAWPVRHTRSKTWGGGGRQGGRPKVEDA